MTFEISLPILSVLFEWPSGFCFPCCLGCQLLFSGFHPLFLFCCVIALVVRGVHFLRARLQSSLLLELLLFLCIGIMGPSPASICLAELWLPRMFAIKLTNLDSFEILKLVCLYGQLEKECKTRMEAYFNWYVETSKNIIRYTLLLPLEKLTIISKDFQIGKILWGLWKLTLSPSGSLCSFVYLGMSTTVLSSLLSISLWTSVLWWWAWAPAEGNYASNGLRKMSIIIMAIWKTHFFFFLSFDLKGTKALLRGNCFSLLVPLRCKYSTW